MANDERVITEHAMSIALLTEAVSSIKDSMKQQTESIREIEKAMKSQELLMEKFANLDQRMTDSVNRIHKRIDRIESRQDEMENEHETKCDLVLPMAQKGANVHGILVKTAWGLGSLVGVMLFSMIVWWIGETKYRP
jgi:chromosome segregation ATPase